MVATFPARTAARVTGIDILGLLYWRPAGHTKQQNTNATFRGIPLDKRPDRFYRLPKFPAYGPRMGLVFHHHDLPVCGDRILLVD